MIILLVIWVGVIFIALKLYFRQLYSKFEKYGVKTLKPTLFFGNMGRVMLRREHMADNIINLYKAFPTEKYVGRYEFFNEMVMICDLELAKKITVKDFEYFIDHRSMFSASESFFARNLISLKGQEWKDMRSALSPAFTSSKIRHMVPLMVEVGDQMIANLKKRINLSKEGFIDIECKDLTTRYGNDVIASCAFGLKVDSLSYKDNEFYTMGKQTTTFTFRQMLVFFCLLNIPKISKYLKLDFMTKASKEFFRYLVLDTMKNRELHHIVRPDMIHLLMELQKGRLTHEHVKSDDKTTGFSTVEESDIDAKNVNRVWSDNDLIAQAVLFFVAGFDTVSTAASFFLYEMAINPEIQEKLSKEITDNALKYNGKFDLKSIQDMAYMDLVVSELLRKWPPVVGLDRVCTKDYNLGRPNENSTEEYTVRKGTGITIPVYAFHRDPQYFPDPDKFDPERFSEGNRHKIHPNAYMPFGLGPRNCIGSRFALCEMKVMVYQILQHFEISPCEKTCIPAELSTEFLNVQLKGGHWLRFRTRT